MAFTADQMVQLKKKIEDRIISLKQDYELARESAKPVSLDESIGRLSRMDAIQQQQVALNHKKQIENELKLLHATLARLHAEDFGLCRSCEEIIAFKRLLLRPDSMFCVNCLKKKEEL